MKIINEPYMEEHIIKNFLKNIDFDFEKARNQVSILEDFEWGYYDKEHEDYKSKKEFEELLFDDYIKRIILKIRFILELVELKEILDSFNSQIAEYKNNYIRFEYVSYLGILYNPVVDLLQMYVNTISSIISIENEKDSKQILFLESILKGTPKIIADRGVIPSNEADVQKEIHDILIHVFPDTLRNVVIPKEITHYKPDFGIRKLKCAIEYKFVDNDIDCKKFIGEIYEDMMAYEGCEDWKNFYAVVYMTDNFLTQAQVDSQLTISKAKDNWKVMLVFGKGKRKKKK